MAKSKLRVLRFEQVLDLLEDGPVPNVELVENLQDEYPKRHVEEVLLKMMNKGYINGDTSKTWKTKDLFFNEL